MEHLLNSYDNSFEINIFRKILIVEVINAALPSAGSLIALSCGYDFEIHQWDG